MTTHASGHDDGEFVVTVTLIVADIARSAAFYRDVLGATVLREGAPTILRLKNTWIIINLGGGPPTDDKPEVTVTPPTDTEHLHESARGRHSTLLRAMALARGAVYH